MSGRAEISGESVAAVTSWVRPAGLIQSAGCPLDFPYTASARIVADLSDLGRQFIHIEARGDAEDVYLTPELAIVFAHELERLATHALRCNRRVDPDCHDRADRRG
ncbi:MAG TPA: hypothetical protein VFN75_03915 [Pseudonocardiaceae bacterium]|nr:hypothetical protein [Pseudonocardiaceae bacterium]